MSERPHGTPPRHLSRHASCRTLGHGRGHARLGSWTARLLAVLVLAGASLVFGGAWWRGGAARAGEGSAPAPGATAPGASSAGSKAPVVDPARVLAPLLPGSSYLDAPETDLVAQAEAAGVDYPVMLMLARRGQPTALAALLDVSTHLDGAGAEGHGWNLLRLLHEVGDARFAGVLAERDLAVRRQVADALAFEWRLDPKAEGGPTPHACPVFRAHYPRTQSILRRTRPARVVVTRGDTFWDYARTYDTTVAAIEAANPGIRPERLRVGMVIALPNPEEPFATARAPAPGEDPMADRLMAMAGGQDGALAGLPSPDSLGLRVGEAEGSASDPAATPAAPATLATPAVQSPPPAPGLPPPPAPAPSQTNGRTSPRPLPSAHLDDEAREQAAIDFVAERIARAPSVLAYRGRIEGRMVIMIEERLAQGWRVYVGEDREEHVTRGLTLVVTEGGAVFRNADPRLLENRWIQEVAPSAVPGGGSPANAAALPSAR